MLPVLAVSVLARRDGNVLLVRRRRPPLVNAWALPGGRVLSGEPLAAAAAREVLEETGVTVSDLQRLDVVEIIDRGPDDSVRSHYVIVVFSAAPNDVAPVAGDDAAEARWVPATELPLLRLAPDTARIIATYAEQSRLPGWSQASRQR
jgi:8-oxo-dGTP diphosphatase